MPATDHALPHRTCAAVKPATGRGAAFGTGAQGSNRRVSIVTSAQVGHLRSTSRILGLGLLVFLAIAPHTTAEWPRWRGPDANGISTEDIRLTPWPAPGPRQVWRASVGTGFSSIAVSQGRLYTLGNSNETDTVYCLAADSGRVLWSYAYACPLDPNLHEGGPGATPAVDGDRVYTLSKFGHLFCFDAAVGTVLWQSQLIEDLGIRKPEWGFAGSPLVDGEKLILNAGNHGLALHKIDGSVLWLSGTNRAGYSSPVPALLNGVRSVVLFSQRNVVAAAVDDGRLLWSHFWATLYDMNIADPVVFQGDFFVTSFNRAATRLNFDGSSTALVWQNRNLSTVLSPGVVLGDHLFAFHAETDTPAEGELRCLDLNSGALAWSAPMRVGSLISADGKLVILTGNGELVLAEANANSYAELARAKVLDGRCWTMPALSAGRLYCRNAVGDLVALALTETPVAPPSLQIQRTADANRLRLAWPRASDGFQLEMADRLAEGANWSEAPTPPVVEGELNVFETVPSSESRFYRLRKP